MDMMKWENASLSPRSTNSKPIPPRVALTFQTKLISVQPLKSGARRGHVHADFKFWLPEGRLEKCSRQMAELYRKWAEMDKLILPTGM